MRDLAPYVLVISVILLVIVAVSIFSQNQQCEVDGGKFVRGLWWYECINEHSVFQLGGINLTAPDR